MQERTIQQKSILALVSNIRQPYATVQIQGKQNRAHTHATLATCASLLFPIANTILGPRETGVVFVRLEERRRLGEFSRPVEAIRKLGLQIHNDPVDGRQAARISSAIAVHRVVAGLDNQWANTVRHRHTSDR